VAMRTAKYNMVRLYSVETNVYSFSIRKTRRPKPENHPRCP